MQKHCWPQQHSNLLPHTCQLNWETLVSAAKFTQQRLQFSQALTEDWKNITKKLAARAVLFFLS